MILGVDPGLAACGWAVLNKNQKVIACGCIKTEKTEKLASRLGQIYSQIQKLGRQHKITKLAIESIFFAKNVKTAVVVAQAMGAIEAAAASLKIEVFEYTPLQIKIAITGYGRAEKKQVIKMLKQTVKNGPLIKNSHTADAVAAGLTHIFTFHPSVKTREQR